MLVLFSFFDVVFCRIFTGIIQTKGMTPSRYDLNECTHQVWQNSCVIQCDKLDITFYTAPFDLRYCNMSLSSSSCEDFSKLTTQLKTYISVSHFHRLWRLLTHYHKNFTSLLQTNTKHDTGILIFVDISLIMWIITNRANFTRSSYDLVNT
jgi:hypothetical protein